jgi:pyruvate ferredoxin oxidoreductase gamma subunit
MAFDRFSDEKIRIHTPVLEPDVVMIVDPTLIGTKGLLNGVSDKTIFVVNTEKSPAETRKALGLDGQTLYTVPANSISHRLFKREIPNSAMMGAFARACPDVISLEALLEEAKHIFSHMLAPHLVDKNVEAIRCGYDEVETV